jgi:hypothetical protein
MTDEQKPLGGDPAVLNELFKRFHQWHRQYLDDFVMIVRAGSEYNKQIAAFHERLLLVSLGTIGLSVTALTAFTPKIPTTAFPRHIFVSYIVPAWISLLVSAILSMGTIGNMIVANAASHHNLDYLVQTYTLRELFVPIKKFAAAFTGTIKVEEEMRDASELFSQLAEKIENDLRQKDVDLKKKLSGLTGSSSIKVASQLAMVTLHIGLILLCISAVKLFLAF